MDHRYRQPVLRDAGAIGDGARPAAGGILAHERRRRRDNLPRDLGRLRHAEALVGIGDTHTDALHPPEPIRKQQRRIPGGSGDGRPRRRGRERSTPEEIISLRNGCRRICPTKINFDSGGGAREKDSPRTRNNAVSEEEGETVCTVWPITKVGGGIRRRRADGGIRTWEWLGRDRGNLASRLSRAKAYETHHKNK